MTSGIERRAQIDNETIRGLLLINGGGAVALLAFVQAIINSSRFELLIFGALAGLLLYQTGLLCAVISNALRRQCSLLYEAHNMRPPKEKMAPCRWQQRLMWTSVACFYAAGLVVFICGVLCLFDMGSF